MPANNFIKMSYTRSYFLFLVYYKKPIYSILMRGQSVLSLLKNDKIKKTTRL